MEFVVFFYNGVNKYVMFRGPRGGSFSSPCDQYNEIKNNLLFINIY